MGEPMQEKLYEGNEQELSIGWKEEGKRYVLALNTYIRLGIQNGWDSVDPDDEPKDSRQPMARAVLDAIRRANATDQIDDINERFPRAHTPLWELIEENGQGMPVVMLLDDGRILARIGEPYKSGYMVVIDDRKVDHLSSEIFTVGRSPNREFFAVARQSGISIHRGWEGETTAKLSWPTGLEGIPNQFTTPAIKDTPTVTQLIPFNSGRKALLVSPSGVFVLSTEIAIRLLPTMEQLQEHFEWLLSEYPNDPLIYELSMEHGAISPDSTLIAAGHQSSMHFVFDTDSYSVIGKIGHMSEYPHFAAFSSDGSMIAFNSCHFYNGMTIGVPIGLLPGLETESCELDEQLVALENGARVYAAVARNDEFIIGDASGYLRAFDYSGKFRWQHFIGSTVGSMDISRDGKRLIVTTYAGFLSILDLDASEADPFAIGTATHHEFRRWLFWKSESNPLIW
jgi:hypothetical protein